MGWSEDKCTGGTPQASNEHATYNAARAFDDNINSSNGGWQAGTGNYVPQWIGYDFGAGNAQAIRKVRMVQGIAAYLSYAPDDFEVRASNTDFEAVDKATLHSVSSAGAWTEDVWREWDFSNSTAYRYVWIYITDCVGGSLIPVINEIEMQVYETVDAEITDDAGMGDAVDLFSLADSVSDDAGMGDAVDLMSLSDEVSDDAGMGDAIAVARAPTASVTGNAGLADDVEITRTRVGVMADDAGMGDAIEFLNYSDWARTNLDLAVVSYYFTLTGAADGETDAEIPITAFQARKRQGEPTYLAVTIKSQDYIDYINDRPNGEMVLDIAYKVSGEVSLRQEILRVDLEDIRIDEGGRSYSITLTGHRTETWSNKIASLGSPIYKSLSDGTCTLRFASPDPFLNPGDTLKIGSDEYTVGYISYSVSENYQTMEVYEAS